MLKAGEFPPSDSGTYIAGELVFIDPINRRGGIRLDGNPPGDRYHSGPLHYFAMLPFGMIWYNGAPAELRDIPLGTHIFMDIFYCHQRVRKNYSRNPKHGKVSCET